MSDIQYQVYDFASSARVERPVWAAMNSWMTKFADLFVEHWANFCSTPIKASPAPIDAACFQDLQASWDKPACGVEISFEADATTGMLVVNRAELRRMLMVVLGDTSEQLEDRELTPIEMSLSELMFEQAASTIGQGWLEQKSLTFSLSEVTNQPNRSRMFPGDKTLLTTGLSIELAAHTIQLTVAIAKEETTKLLGIEKLPIQSLDPNVLLSRDKLAEIEVQVTAGLGSAELAMNELVSLTIGDIVVLDQSVEDPLVLFANDEPLLKGWPGRANEKQALKIVS